VLGLKWSDFSPETQTKIASKVQSGIFYLTIGHLQQMIVLLVKVGADKSVISADGLPSVSSQKLTNVSPHEHARGKYLAIKKA
jgi:hypothetical protein